MLHIALLLPTPLLGINLAGPADWNTELPFNDLFRMARPWVSQREGAGWGQGPKLETDSRGYIKRLEPGCFAETPLLTDMGGHFPAGDYTLTYKGKGRITFNGNAQVVFEAPGQIVARVDPAKGYGLFIQLRATDPADPVRDLSFFAPGTSQSRTPFSKGFLKRWHGVAAFRFMDWAETNNSPLTDWASRPKVDQMTWSEHGIPVEIMVALCNEQNADGWFCMPHAATDDYIQKCAAYVGKNLKPGLKAYVEYSNEVWNPGFGQHRYASDQGAKLGFGGDQYHNAWHYTARRSKEIFAIWERELPKTRLVRVLAAQAGWDEPAKQILAFEDAGHYADALAIAPYFGITPSPSSDPSSDTVSHWSQKQVLDKLATVIQEDVPKMVRSHASLAKQYGLRLIAYEAGQHAVGIQGGENNQALTDLFMNTNRSAGMGELYGRYLKAWQANGGQELMAFSSTGGYSKWGSWGALEYSNQQTTPKYKALVDWAASLGQTVGGTKASGGTKGLQGARTLRGGTQGR